MCGIVGAIGNIIQAHEKMVHQMLIFDSVRGDHSTGLLGVRKFHEDEYLIAKQVGNPYELHDTKAYKEIMSGSSRVLLGHNRFATQGKVNKANAHPYDFDTLVGVHNGSLQNKYQMHQGNYWDVDSQALYAHIDEKGVEDALRTARGAFALVWWNKNENTVNFIRNEERPLFYALTEEPQNKVMLFASERWMIEAAAGRCGIKIFEPQIFETGYLHTVPVEKGGNLGKPVIRPIEFGKPFMQAAAVNRGSVNVAVNNGTVVVKEGTKHTQSFSTTSTINTNVVTINRKSILDAEFVAKKDLIFEAVCIQEDRTKAKYVVCYDPKHPYYECRLYLHNNAKKIFDDVGCEFEGDVSSFVMVDGACGYYKISPHGLRITAFAEQVRAAEAGEQAAREALEVAEDAMVPDHHGVDMERDEWRKKYGVCVFCTSNVQPEDLEEGARFTKDGEILCPDCVKDEKLVSYVALV